MEDFGSGGLVHSTTDA